MTLEEVDIKLAAWQSDVSTLHANLAEIQALLGYVLARDGRTVTGESLKIHNKGVEAEARLWTGVALFAGLVNTIETKRKDVPRFRQGSYLAEIEKLFEGDSIELAPEAVALKERDIFSGGQSKRKITPAKLRELMSRDFAELRDCYVKLGDAWTTIGLAISEATDGVERIKAEERRYGRSNSADIASLAGRLESTTRRWRQDPLGVTEDIRADLQPYFKAANNFIAQLAAARAKIAVDIKDAGSRLEALRDMKNKALELHLECATSFTTKEEAKAPPSTRGLTTWLAKISADHADEKWDEAETGIREWFGLYDRIRASMQECVNFNQGLVDKKSALKKRFLSAVTKYRSYAAQGMAIPKSVQTFTDTGQEMLRGKLDIDEFETIVLSLEVKVDQICVEFDRQKQGGDKQA